MRQVIFTFLISLLFIDIFSQQNEGGIPLSFNYDLLEPGTLKSTHVIGQIIFDPVDNEKEIQNTDSINRNSSKKLGYYGKLISTDIDLINDTKPIQTETGNLYLFHVISPTAYGLQFYFDNFHIADGGRLFIYNEEKNMILGAFTNKNNNASYHFGTQYIVGNSVFIEYFEPKEIENQSSLHIDNIVHAFKPLLSTSDEWGTNESCFIDLVCEEDSKWIEIGASVALILSIQVDENYSYWCSGSLINNTNNDGKPYFLSASHCADTFRIKAGYDSSRFDISSWIFLFNYQKKECGGTQSALSNHSIYGAKILSIDTNFAKGIYYDRYYSDHLLLELNATVENLQKYNITYAGWDINDDAAYNSEYAKSIHHPSGSPKNISTCGMVFSGTMNDSLPDIQWIAQWYEGVTALGSSGAPLFNDEYKIIGQLHGGNSYCDNPGGFDYYNKFSISYDYGKLKQWLDPGNTNITSLDALNPEDVKTHQDFIKFQYDRILHDIRIYLLERVTPNSYVNLRFVNIAGQVLYKHQYIGKNILDFKIPNLTSGVYFIWLDYNFKTVVKKVLVVK